MNPLLWKAIVEYMQTRRIDTGEYEITDPAGKKYRARQEGKETTGTKDWRIDISDPENSPYPDDPWVYSDHARTLKDAKEHIIDTFDVNDFISQTPEDSQVWGALQRRVRELQIEKNQKIKEDRKAMSKRAFGFGMKGFVGGGKK